MPALLPFSSRTAGMLAVALLFYLFLSFPFFIRNLDTGLYKLGLLILLLLNAVWQLGSRAFMHGLQQLLMEGRAPWLRLAVLFYAAYWLILLLVSLLNPTEFTAGSLSYKLTVLVLAVFFFAALDLHAIRKIVFLYTNLLVVLALGGMLLTAGIFWGWINGPSGTMLLDNGQTRDIYWQGLVWPDIWYGSTINLVRLQSFSDEAGTFAFALLPALFFSFAERHYWKTFILLTALFLTFSLGAIVFVLLCSAIYLISRHAMHPRRFVFSLIAVAGVTATLSPLISDTLLGRYLAEKFFTPHDYQTSFGQRFENVSLVITTFFHTDNPLGLGAGAERWLGSNMAVGWLVPLAESGLIGFAFYISAVLLLLWQCLQAVLQRSAAVPFALVVIALAFAAAQRGEMDASVWHFFWIIAFIKAYNHEQRALAYNNANLKIHSGP